MWSEVCSSFSPSDVRDWSFYNVAIGKITISESRLSTSRTERKKEREERRMKTRKKKEKREKRSERRAFAHTHGCFTRGILFFPSSSPQLCCEWSDLKLIINDDWQQDKCKENFSFVDRFFSSLSFFSFSHSFIHLLAHANRGVTRFDTGEREKVEQWTRHDILIEN